MSAEIVLHRLFFAVLLDHPVGERANRLAGTLADAHRLRGRPLPAHRLHVSLCKVGASPGAPPADVVGLACRVGERVAMSPFEVAFDRVQSWRRSNGPVVLVGDDDKLIGLRRLGDALAEAQGMRPNRHVEPHVSLLWTTDELAERAVEPLSWTVRDFALIHSIHGQGRHQVLGRWALHERRTP
jgi:2'-5' RNA ligase